MGLKPNREQVEHIIEMARQQQTTPDLNAMDLAEADLSEMDLSHVNLNQANLHRANLYKANLSGSDLSGATMFIANLGWANLSEANLTEAKLSWADLNGANLSQADLHRADLSGANLFDVNLTDANLNEAELLMANLNDANLTGANLREAKLTGATLVNTNFTRADLTNCSVYGISAWELKLEGAKQSNLNISHWNEPVITVDNLEIAQFIHLLLHNNAVRQIIDKITAKIVLILGCFSPEQRLVVDILQDELRKRHYSPVVFDFDQATGEAFTEKIAILARMSQFVIIDLTRATIILDELRRIISELPNVPFQPLVSSTHFDADLFEELRRYPSVLEVYCYSSLSHLLAFLSEQVIMPAENKLKELAKEF